MRILVAGATGALGSQLVPRLETAGHDVFGLSRSASGPRVVRADALDREAVARAVALAKPEVIVHQLTALSGRLDLRHFDRDFAATNRLRTEGTDNLLSAGRAVGVRLFVAQSYAGWPYARTGGPVKAEGDPLDSNAVPAMRRTLDAIRYLESAVAAADGIVLRYGGFYGPGTSLDPEGGVHAAAIRARRFPIVGDGAGVWSFIHVADAAEATVAAIERGRPGVYNVVDDEPLPVCEWLPVIAEALGGPPPRRVPRWVGRIAAGEAGVVMMTEVRGASNAKARQELGWRPAYPSVREGFAVAATEQRVAA